MVPEDPPPPTLPPPPSTNEEPATGTSAGITKCLPLGEATTKGLQRLASLLQYLTVSGIPDGNISDLLAQIEGLVKPVSTPRDVERLCVYLSKGPCTTQQRTGVPEPATPAPTTGAQTATHSVAGGGSWQPATRISPRTYAQAVGSAENARPAGHATGMPTRTHKASAREVLMAAVQPVWSTATNPRPKEVILGNLRNTGAVTPPELRRAMSRLTGVSSVELLDISFHGGRCYATLHAAAVPKFTRAVRRGVHDVRSEEHTSELQSLTNLVCRLLLEKKKTQKKKKEKNKNKHPDYSLQSEPNNCTSTHITLVSHTAPATDHSTI